MPSNPSHPSTPYPSGELLTRQWLNPILLDPFEFESDSVKLFQSYKEGTTKTKQKLNELHERLGNHKKLLLLQQRILDPIGTVDWLREKVGIWHIVREADKERWVVRDELLPTNGLLYQTYWDFNAWGEEEKENGLLRIMLSPTAISWLNELNKWCDEVELTNEREMI
jgi:hypothetical protein